MGVVGNIANWVLISNSIGSLFTLTGNSGGAVGPSAGNINVIGDGITINVVGNPATNTLTISASGVEANSFPTDAGTAIPASGVLKINAANGTNNCGSSVSTSAPGPSNTVLLNVTDANHNTTIGEGSSNTLAGILNTSLGYLTFGAGTLTSTGNVAIGASSQYAKTSGSANSSLGSASLAALTSGGGNTILGYQSAQRLGTGSYNSTLGYNSGSAWTTSESGNVAIQSAGVITESNILRIGDGTGTGTNQFQAAYVSGIDGFGLTTANVVTEVSNQLGTAVITGGTGITVTPGANTITITNSAPTVTILETADTNQVTPTTGIINIIGSNGITTTGTVGPNTVTVVGNNTQNRTSWTPSLQFGGASTGITYTLQSGYYTQIGNTIIWSFSIALSSVGSASGNATVVGMPWTVNSFGFKGYLANFDITYSAGYTALQYNMQDSVITLEETGSDQTETILQNAGFANSSQFNASGIYFLV